MNRLHQWRRWIRPLVVVSYTIILVIALSLMIVELERHPAEWATVEWFVGGLFVLLALPISLWGIIQHLIHYTQPHLQRHIIRIIWMVPIYAINAWFGMRFHDAAIYLDSARECYEAYVIYNFMSYLLSFLQSEYPNIESRLGDKPQVSFPPPLCLVPPWKIGRELMLHCKHGVMQYTVVRPITTFIAFACYMASSNDHDYYGEGIFNFRSAWSYLIIINNFSQIFSMFCLVMFYKATREELAPIKPIAKFMCVKTVVFMSFWQGVLIAILVNSNAIPKEVGDTLQDFCICIEMLIAAVAHYFSFSHRPYIDLAADPNDCCESFRSMWDVSDVQKDVVEHIRHVGSTASGMLVAPIQGMTGNGKAVKPNGTEMTPLLRIDGGEDVIFSQFHSSPDIILGVDNYGASPDLVLGMNGSGGQPRVFRGGPATARGGTTTKPADSTSNPEASLLDKDVPVSTESACNNSNQNSRMVQAEIHQTHSDLLTFDDDNAESFVSGGR